METDEKIDSKKKMLENYFGWKPKKWLIKLGRKKSANVKIKCKICVKEISIKFMNKHSEVCMKKKQMCNKLKTIQSNFNKFITVSENIVRYQKTYYRIEKYYIYILINIIIYLLELVIRNISLNRMNSI